ncbi:unnamed protein product [Parajaminaea phylloscopi]
MNEQVQARIEEVILIRSALVVADEFVWTGTAEECESWQQSIDSGQWPTRGQEEHTSPPAPAPAYSFRIRLRDGGAQSGGSSSSSNKKTQDHRAAAVDASSPWLQIDMSSQNLDRDPRLDVVVVLGDGSRAADAGKSEQLEGFRERMAARWKESGDEGMEHRLFDLMTFLQDAANDFDLRPAAPSDSVRGGEAAAEMLPNDAGSTRSDELQSKSDQDAAAPSQTSFKMACVIFWSHHLIANSKRRDFASWSTELGLWVLLKIGWPGYICIQGLHEDVYEMVRRVKGLQWAAIQIKWEEEWTYQPLAESARRDSRRSQADGDVSEALLSCSLATAHSAREEGQRRRDRGDRVKGGCEEVHEMKEIVDRMKLAGLDDKDLVGALGLRTKAS